MAGTTHRLDVADRRLLGVVGVLAGAAVVVAIDVYFHGSVSMDRHQTSREAGVSAQALRVAGWALITPACAWLVLRGGRIAAAAASIWVAAVLTCAWWWWPNSPISAWDRAIEPVWHATYAPVVWSLVAACLATSLFAAWKSSHPAVRIAAVSLVAVLVVGAGWSLVRLDRHAAAEQPLFAADGSAELRVLAADGLWGQLPSGIPGTFSSHAAYRTAWGALEPTSMSQQLAGADQVSVFRAAVAAAEDAGWKLADAFCNRSDWRATFRKNLSVGPAMLDVAIYPYAPGVSVGAQVQGRLAGADRDKACWTTS